MKLRQGGAHGYLTDSCGLAHPFEKLLIRPFTKRNPPFSRVQITSMPTNWPIKKGIDFAPFVHRAALRLLANPRTLRAAQTTKSHFPKTRVFFRTSGATASCTRLTCAIAELRPLDDNSSRLASMASAVYSPGGASRIARNSASERPAIVLFMGGAKASARRTHLSLLWFLDDDTPL